MVTNSDVNFDLYIKFSVTRVGKFYIFMFVLNVVGSHRALAVVRNRKRSYENLLQNRLNANERLEFINRIIHRISLINLIARLCS